MYGMLLESAQHYLQLKYGKDFWEQICYDAGVTNRVFVTHECYSDSLVPRIAKACAAKFQSQWTVNDFMEFFGRCFLRFTSHYGYDRVLKVYGREFRDFLHGIDNLHEHMRFGFPRLQAPSFRCEQETSTGINLHYMSKRYGYQMYVVGQIKECANLYFNMDIEVQILKESGSLSNADSTKSHVTYRVFFDNSKYSSILQEPQSAYMQGGIPIEVLFSIFPFSFVLNEELTFVRAGSGLKNYLGYSIINMNINNVFTLRRPIATLTWAKLIKLNKVIFELISKHVMTRKERLVKRKVKTTRFITVKEEMDESEAVGRSTNGVVTVHLGNSNATDELPQETTSDKAVHGKSKSILQNGKTESTVKIVKESRLLNGGFVADEETLEHQTGKPTDETASHIHPELTGCKQHLSHETDSFDDKLQIFDKNLHPKLAISKSSGAIPVPKSINKPSFSDDIKSIGNGIDSAHLGRRARSLADQSQAKHDKRDLERLFERPTEKPLHLRGQMLYVQKWNKVLFIGSPIIGTLEDLRETGLYLNDLSMYDGSRQTVLAGTQKLSQLELSRDMETLYGKMLRETADRLDREKQKSDILLYSLMPKEIADRLKNGETQLDTCETFDDVTILFSYVEGFDAICESAEPMLIVKLINELFSVFDSLTEKHNVYKFETLGDAIYMLVSGAPVPARSHAHEMAYMALDMLREVQRIKSPANGAPLELKIGIHSGPVVAGVIGEKTPQYCLFGNTVNIASRMQSTGEPMKIHISSETKSRLLMSLFITELRGSITVKGVGSMETFWLLGSCEVAE